MKWDFAKTVQNNCTQAALHRFIQYGFMVFYIWIALMFGAHVLWAFGKTTIYVSPPPAVDAFLPIGALLAFKRFVLTGEYDMVRPAALTLLMYAMGISFLLRRSFCGYLCPIGGLSGLIHRFGKRLRVTYQPKGIIAVVLSAPKYILMVSILYRLVLPLDVPSINSFLSMPYWRIADTKMLLYFWHPSQTVVIALAVIVLGSLIIPSFWCRSVCPYGALLGMFSLFSPVAVRRNEQSCTGCAVCTRACPVGIAVHTKKRVFGPECLGCGECVGACKQKDTLAFRLGYTAKATPIAAWTVPVATLIILLLVVTWAKGTYRWEREENPRLIRMDHMQNRPDWLE